MSRFTLLLLLVVAACHTQTATPPPDPAAPPAPTSPPQQQAGNWRYAQPPATVDHQPSPLPPSPLPATPPAQAPREERYTQDDSPRTSSPPAKRDSENKAEASLGGSASGFDGERARGKAASNDAYRPAPRHEPAPERPGLGTSWGEQRYSQVSETAFERASTSPTFTSQIWYNDRQGAESMARYASGWASLDRATLNPVRGLFISLRDEYGAALPGFRANGRVYAIGEHNRRYTIVVENRTNTRFEIVASVDGLDVLDGRDASYNKRGYIVDPYGRIEIDGFRQSESAVAAFRFGSTRDSYAAQTTGSDRNVGVVGIAAFAERQYQPYWSYHEAERRQQADPFPAKWAQQPDRYYQQDMYQAR